MVEEIDNVHEQDMEQESVFFTDDEFKISNTEGISILDLEMLQELDILSYDTISTDDGIQITNCEVDVYKLASAATEFNTLERKMYRWDRSGWDPRRVLINDINR